MDSQQLGPFLRAMEDPEGVGKIDPDLDRNITKIEEAVRMTIDPRPAVGQIWASRDWRDAGREIELIEETAKDGAPAFKTRPLNPGGVSSTIKAANVPTNYRYVRQANLGQRS